MSTHELNAICDVCKDPIADGEGNIWLRSTDLVLAENATRAREERRRTKAKNGFIVFPHTELPGFPEAAEWNVTHTVCAPGTDASAYSFGVHQCRTWAGLVNWTAHLLEKGWLRHTDWADLLRSASEGDGGRITPATNPRPGV